MSNKRVSAVYQGDFQRLKIQLEGDFRSSTPRSDMDKAQLLAGQLLLLVSGILNSLPNDHKEHQINSGGDTPVRNLVDALKEFTRGEYAGYFPVVAGR